MDVVERFIKFIEHKIKGQTFKTCKWQYFDLSFFECVSFLQLYPAVAPSIIQKDLTIEIKIDDFIENAVCLQLLHAGEKINIQSSKFTLVKYNDILRNVLKISKSVISL